jgi:hypothetical protein
MQQSHRFEVAVSKPPNLTLTEAFITSSFIELRNHNNTRMYIESKQT